MASEELNYNATENAITWLHSNINVASGALHYMAANLRSLASIMQMPRKEWASEQWAAVKGDIREGDKFTRSAPCSSETTSPLSAAGRV